MAFQIKWGKILNNLRWSLVNLWEGHLDLTGQPWGCWASGVPHFSSLPSLFPDTLQCLQRQDLRVPLRDQRSALGDPARQGVGVDDLQGSLPTSAVLSFYESVRKAKKKKQTKKPMNNQDTACSFSSKVPVPHDLCQLLCGLPWSPSSLVSLPP